MAFEKVFLVAQTRQLILPVKFLIFQGGERQGKFVPRFEVGEIKLKVNIDEKDSFFESTLAMH